MLTGLAQSQVAALAIGGIVTGYRLSLHLLDNCGAFKSHRLQLSSGRMARKLNGKQSTKLRQNLP